MPAFLWETDVVLPWHRAEISLYLQPIDSGRIYHWTSRSVYLVTAPVLVNSSNLFPLDYPFVVILVPDD